MSEVPIFLYITVSSSFFLFLTGKYPCLWCLITSQTMQLPRSDPQRGHVGRRTLQAIQEDYDKFVEDGSCTSRQKFYHNVIHERLLDIDLDKVIN